jgi:virginiamycin B lyase
MSARLRVTVLATLLVGSASMTQAQTIPIIVEYPVSSSLGPGPITASGEVWFALPNDNKVGQISITGEVTLYSLPSPYEEPRGIAAGPDDTVWFTETGGFAGGEGIARITQDGTITEFPLPADTRPFGLTFGPDGNVWFTKVSPPYAIGQMTPSGTMMLLEAPLAAAPLNITSGPDGSLWFAEDGLKNGAIGAIGRMTTSGDLTEYPLPTAPGNGSRAEDITVGPDGNLWFTWSEGSSIVGPPLSRSIGRITPAGSITQFPLGSDPSFASAGITAGPDGNLWFTEPGSNRIGKISVSGAVEHFSIPTPNSLPIDITVGGDGALWFSEADASKIGRLVLSSLPISAPPPPISATATTCRGHAATHTGSSANDTLIGSPGAEVLVGLGGNDTIKGHGGADRVCAGEGNDRVSGGAGNDRLQGEEGKDTLRGGPGKDRLAGGTKHDKCNGGSGRDRGNSCEVSREIP